MPIPRKPSGPSGRSANAPTKPPVSAPAQRVQEPLRENIEDEIRQRAYELYEERGREEGHHEEDWTRAEEEVLARRGRKSA